MGPDQVIGRFIQPDQRQPDQRRVRKIEALALVLTMQARELTCTLLLRPIPPVQLDERQLHAAPHELVDALLIHSDEGCTKDLVAVDDLFPGVFERLDVEWSYQVA